MDAKDFDLKPGDVSFVPGSTLGGGGEVGVVGTDPSLSQGDAAGRPWALIC